MTMQFLASVRRNQRQWMVVITIMSIFAFLVDDVRGANRLSGSSTALFFAVLCGAGMSIIGYPRGHTVMYGLVGFFVGGAAAFVGTTYSAPKAPVQTSFGSLSKEKLTELQRNRMRINQFLVSLVDKTEKGARAPLFGQGNNSVEAMTSFSVLNHEAKRMGVNVSDEAVTEFLRDATNKKLTEKAYIGALKESGLAESEVFGLIRNELEVQLVQRLLSPPAAGVQMYLQYIRGAGRTAFMTPDQRWENFRKMNVREGLTAVALPVTEFVKPDLVAEPSESELREYFDKRKSFRGDEYGNPGFLEMPKVKLAYLKAADLEIYEKGLAEPTDQEVVTYYLANRDRYRIFDIPDSPDSSMPDLKSGAENVEGAADAATPVNVVPEAPVGPGPSNPPATDVPEKEKAATDELKKEPAKEGDKPQESAKEEPKCGDEEAAKKDEPAKSDPAEEAVKPVAEEKKDPQPAESAKENEAPPAPALPSGDAELPPKLTPPAMPPRFPAPGAPARYRELDDDLKLDIRETLLRDKAFSKMSDAADKAFEFMMEMGMKYLSADAKERDKISSSFADQCKAYAEKNGLEYHETKEMTQMELSSSLDEKIGDADEAVSSQRNARKVYQLCFETNSSGRGPRVSLYAPQRADSLTARYAYWKISEIPAKIPDLANKETRQLVLDSWKFEKARTLAQARANDLAELIRKAPADVSAALSGQTINGTKDSPPVSVREVPMFSWLRTSQSVPTMGLPFPTESNLGGEIGNPGPDFFKLVFEKLSDGEVGVSLNPQKTVFYVVKVHDRDGSGPDGGVVMQELQQKFLKERFTSEFPTPYDFLASQEQQLLDMRWVQNFNKHFGITFNNVTSGEDE
ncbi:MAG: hypothetical protein JWP89_551 [Schlesneria sp.]|nr:hypothetical protein [Schlesneria sp.]